MTSWASQCHNKTHSRRQHGHEQAFMLLPHTSCGQKLNQTSVVFQSDVTIFLYQKQTGTISHTTVTGHTVQKAGSVLPDHLYHCYKLPWPEVRDHHEWLCQFFWDNEAASRDYQNHKTTVAECVVQHEWTNQSHITPMPQFIVHQEWPYQRQMALVVECSLVKLDRLLPTNRHHNAVS